MVPPRTSLQRARWGPWLWVVGALALVAVAAAVLWWAESRRSASRAVRTGPAPAAQAPDASTAAPSPTPGPEEQRSLLEALSSDPLVRRGLQDGEVVRRYAIVVDNLAEGVSPRRELGFLAPGQGFSVVRRGERSVIAPESFARYDAFAAAVSSVNAAAAARAYRALHGAIEAAYRALGYPDASLDRVTARALRRIVNAPVRDGDVAVEPREGRFVYADPALEGLGEVEKHLLRMGPRNTRALQAKARELLDALSLAGER